MIDFADRILIAFHFKMVRNELADKTYIIKPYTMYTLFINYFHFAINRPRVAPEVASCNQAGG